MSGLSSTQKRVIIGILMDQPVTTDEQLENRAYGLTPPYAGQHSVMEFHAELPDWNPALQKIADDRVFARLDIQFQQVYVVVSVLFHQ